LDPRKRFYLEVFGVAAIGFFFVGLGACGVILSMMNLNFNPRLLYAGAGGIALGLIIAWKSLQYLRPLKPKTEFTVFVCPHCSAIVEEDAESCPKCGKTVAKPTQ
jgi:hypothetical protein